MNAIVKFDAVTDLAHRYGLEAEAFVTTMKGVAMPSPHTDQELVSCLLVAREHRLNPLTKEIYFMRTKAGAIQPIVGVDGWIRKCNEHPEFNGVEFEDVKDASGKVEAMTCHMYRKDRDHPISVTEYLDECSKGGAVWKTHPRRMLRNRTYCQAARMAFGFAGIMEPDEYSQWQSDEPIALETVEPDRPRDGGDLPGSTKHRPASGAFKDLGGEDKYHTLIASFGECETIEELQACFDGFERHGVPWADFPLGWARQIQGEYHYRMKDLNEPDDEPLADQAGVFDMIKDALDAADSAEIVQEIIDSNAELVKRCAPDMRLRIAELYEAKL